MGTRASDRIDRLDRRSAALVVVDAQNDFGHPEGLLAKQGRNVGLVQKPLERLKGLIASARAHKVPVYLIQNIHAPGSDTREWLERHADAGRAQTCQIGTWGAEFCGITPAPEDTVVVKHRYSAFIRTTLEAQLRANNRSSLLFAGLTTATCVESSFRDAVCLDFAATVVEDCCAAYDEVAHANAVRAMGTGFGEVCTAQHVMDYWDSAYGTPGETRDMERVGQ